MKTILLGASGQLGQEWQAFFNEQLPEEQILLPYTSSQLDITHREELAHELKIQEPDIIINCAAYTDVDGAEEHQDAALKVNAEAVSYLASLSTELDCILVHFSTDYVFPGALEDRHRLPQGYGEDHPTNPINYYGKSKLQGEKEIRNSGCRHVIIRVSWLCGAFGSNFVKTMLKLGRERDHLQVVDDQWGTPSFTDNVVANTWQLLKENRTGTFHITSEGLITWYDLAKAIFETAGLEVEVEPVSSDKFPTAAERPHFSKLNTEKIRNIQGIEIIDWRAGLASMFDQLKA